MGLAIKGTSFASSCYSDSGWRHRTAGTRDVRRPGSEAHQYTAKEEPPANNKDTTELNAGHPTLSRIYFQVFKWQLGWTGSDLILSSR